MAQTLSSPRPDSPYRWPPVDRRTAPAPDDAAASPSVVEALDLLMDQEDCGPRAAMLALRAQAALLSLSLDRAAQVIVALSVGPSATAALRQRWTKERQAAASSLATSA